MPARPARGGGRRARPAACVDACVAYFSADSHASGLNREAVQPLTAMRCNHETVRFRHFAPLLFDHSMKALDFACPFHGSYYLYYIQQSSPNRSEIGGDQRQIFSKLRGPISSTLSLLLKGPRGQTDGTALNGTGSACRPPTDSSESSQTHRHQRLQPLRRQATPDHSARTRCASPRSLPLESPLCRRKSRRHIFPRI